MKRFGRFWAAAQPPGTAAPRPLGWSLGSCGGGAGCTLPRAWFQRGGWASVSPPGCGQGQTRAWGSQPGWGPPTTAPGMVQPPGRGRLADGPGGAGVCARACGPGARLRARSLAQHSQRSGPVPSTVLSFLHLASESPRAEGGGWSCPGHVGFCLRRGGLPGGCLGFRSPGRSVRVRRLGQTFAENRTTPHRPGELDLPR